MFIRMKKPKYIEEYFEDLELPKPYINFFPRVNLQNKTIKHKSKKKEENKFKCRRTINYDIGCE